MHLLTLKDFGPRVIREVIDKILEIKKKPGKYSQALKQKTLLMLFQKPSLRTRVSFEVAMEQMGGHAIYYAADTGPLGKKESIEDTAKVVERYCDIVMARVFEHKDLEEWASNSKIPVINALSNFEHPCQIISDFVTILEKKKKIKGLKLAYLGDSNNNVTHSLLYGCSMMGLDISIGCPKGKEYSPNENVVKESKKFAKESGSKIIITDKAEEAVKDADIVYTDSWMSYHIPEEQKEKRVKVFKPYQVTKELMNLAKKDAIFMNCLPALRGYEQTGDVIDGKQSVVFDQAENRLHSEKAIILKCLELF